MEPKLSEESVESKEGFCFVFFRWDVAACLYAVGYDPLQT